MKEYIDQLEAEGFCRIPQLVPPRQIEKALQLTQAWHEATKDMLPHTVPYLTRGQHIVYNLQNKDYFFLQLLFSLPTVHDILRHFLNDPWFKQIPSGQPNYILRSYLARSSALQLPLHIDSFVPYEGSHVFAMQVSMLLQDQSTANGCFMVVPGSHKRGAYAEQSAFTDAQPVMAAAGDVVLWDSRVWHGTVENTTEGTRWAVIATFMRWWIKQAFRIPETLPADILARLTSSQKAVLGFCSMPFAHEFEGIDMKRGYEELPDEPALDATQPREAYRRNSG
jgi:hypothetical protein